MHDHVRSLVTKGKSSLKFRIIRWGVFEPDHIWPHPLDWPVFIQMKKILYGLS